MSLLYECVNTMIAGTFLINATYVLLNSFCSQWRIAQLLMDIRHLSHDFKVFVQILNFYLQVSLTIHHPCRYVMLCFIF